MTHDQIKVLLTLLLIGAGEGTSIAKRQSSDEPNYQQLLDQMTALQSQVHKFKSIISNLLHKGSNGQYISILNCSWVKCHSCSNFDACYLKKT